MSETPLSTRDDLRNLAIVAHVDHGKTTLVDGLLRQSGAFRSNETVTDRVMDSNDLEREKGITILAKNTSVIWGGVTLNIVDTPGHADFGGEVERALTMVDGIVLLVDAAEGPLPQTRFVLRKALAYDMPVILVINKVDRPDARIAEVVDEVYELFMDLDAKDHQLDFPIVYSLGPRRLGVARPRRQGRRPRPAVRRRPRDDPGADVHRGRAAAGLGHQPRCQPLPRPARAVPHRRGHHPQGPAGRLVPRRRFDPAHEGRRALPDRGAHPRARRFRPSGRSRRRRRHPRDHDRRDARRSRRTRPRSPSITVDEPALSMTIGINTSPLAGREGSKLTARLVKNRLDAELVGNVSIRVNPTDRPDAWEVQARGELQLAILVETMRREGFELTVGKPEVVTKLVDGKQYEPVERVTIDTPDDHLGAVTQLLAGRKGRMENMINHGLGWVRLEYLVPARGLIGFRTEFLTETRGFGVISHIFEDYEPWFGEIRARERGSLVADRTGPTTTYAMTNLQDRSTMMVGPGTDVYHGHDRRRELPFGRHGRQHLPREEAHEHARVVVRRDDQADAAPRAVARARARVHRERRVHRGHPEAHPAAQGVARSAGSAPGGQEHGQLERRLSRRRSARAERCRHRRRRPSRRRHGRTPLP